EQLQVRCLPAARACARELEERLQELRAADRAEVDPRPVVDRDRLEERNLARAIFMPPPGRDEVDRPARGARHRADRTRLDAQAAAGAVLGIDLQRVARVR